MGEFDLKTEFVTPESGSLVLCWDTLFLKSQNMKDRLPCHGKIGVVVKKTHPNDEDDKTFVIHQQWLKVMEAEAQEGNYGY